MTGPDRVAGERTKPADMSGQSVSCPRTADGHLRLSVPCPRNRCPRCRAGATLTGHVPRCPVTVLRTVTVRPRVLSYRPVRLPPGDRSRWTEHVLSRSVRVLQNTNRTPFAFCSVFCRRLPLDSNLASARFRAASLEKVALSTPDVLPHMSAGGPAETSQRRPGIVWCGRRTRPRRVTCDSQ